MTSVGTYGRPGPLAATASCAAEDPPRNLGDIPAITSEQCDRAEDDGRHRNRAGDDQVKGHVRPRSLARPGSCLLS
jgi:hypothetical protein